MNIQHNWFKIQQPIDVQIAEMHLIYLRTVSCEWVRLSLIQKNGFIILILLIKKWIPKRGSMGYDWPGIFNGKAQINLKPGTRRGRSHFNLLGLVNLESYNGGW